MEKIDKRRHYVLVFDTETANTIQNGEKVDMSNVLVYDCGWAVVDTKGNVYRERSFVNRDIFCYERDLMQSAYYGWKIPQYVEDIRNGERQMADLYEIRQTMLADMREYGITEVVAHNARFDINALNGTQRYVSKSKWRYWFPYGTEVWDSILMARSVIHKMPTYRTFCEEWDLMTKNNRLPTSAQTLYRFIINDPTFEEEHKGLDDVRIEREIMWYCYRQHKEMKKVLYAAPEESDPPTELQKKIMRLVKENA